MIRKRRVATQDNYGEQHNVRAELFNEVVLLKEPETQVTVKYGGVQGQRDELRCTLYCSF